MDRIEQASPLTMGWCIECHRTNAHVSPNTVERAVANLREEPKPRPGLDCASCHY
jgi:hypothetical protein